MNTTTQQAIESVRKKIDEASAELRALEARAAEEARRPWEPKGGRFYLHPMGTVKDGPSEPLFAEAGSEYPTREAAESALPYVTFFRRLCCLAAELNPSGKVGGHFGVLTENPTWAPRHIAAPENRDPWDLFETRDAALKACEILNRDGWKTPTL